MKGELWPQAGGSTPVDEVKYPPMWRGREGGVEIGGEGQKRGARGVVGDEGGSERCGGWWGEGGLAVERGGHKGGG